MKQASKVRQTLRSEEAHLGGGRLADELERFEGLIERVVDQSERRVLNGESVAAGEKLVSLFEEHTAMIARGKAAKKTEFGRKVWLEEVEGASAVATAYWKATPLTTSNCSQLWRTT